MKNPAVDVKWSAVLRARGLTGNGDTWVLLRTKSGSLDDFVDAILAADALTAAQDPEADPDEAGYAQAPPARTPRGFVVRVDGVDEGLLRIWLTNFAEQLERRGFSGSLTGAPNTWGPAWARGTRKRFPAAFVSWTLELDEALADPEGDRRWWVSRAATGRIAQLSDRWARAYRQNLDGADEAADTGTVVTLGRFGLAFDAPDASDLLATGPFQAHTAGIEIFDNRARTGTHVQLGPTGETTFQDFGTDLGPGAWQSQVERLLEALLPLSADINFGFI